jgi:hypothetical protein
MLVRYGEHLILTYRRGRFAFHVGESARSDVYGVGQALSFRFGPRNVEQLKADLRFERGLKWIARAMLRQRHGGTVLILPEGANWEPKASSKRYAPTAPVTIVKEADAQDIEHMEKRGQASQQLMQGQPSPEAAFYLADDMIRARFASELEWLGRLTATDGMTVILRDLTLLGFGVFFDTQENHDDVTRVVVIDDYDDGTDHEPKALASIGGARHQSAAVTCRHFPGAIALVASQDGSLSSMTWDAERNVVVTFRHRELLLDV